MNEFRKRSIEIHGCIAADGIAEYTFDKTYLGNHYEPTLVHAEKTYKKASYEMSKLEEAILGYLKERLVDIQTSDLTKGFFEVAKKKFADPRIKCCYSTKI